MPGSHKLATALGTAHQRCGPLHRLRILVAWQQLRRARRKVLCTEQPLTRSAFHLLKLLWPPSSRPFDPLAKNEQQQHVVGAAISGVMPPTLVSTFPKLRGGKAHLDSWTARLISSPGRFSNPSFLQLLSPQPFYISATHKKHNHYLSATRIPSNNRAMSLDQGVQTGIILSTALASFVTGYLFGIFTTRGYFISPALAAERRRNLGDPVESDESDVDETDSLLDHAPNWANGEEADRRQGLRFEAKTSDQKASTRGSDSPTPIPGANGECKLVLVVRTDLGMTKGKIAAQCSHATLACYKALSRASSDSSQRATLARWERHGQTKIAVQVKSQEELLELRRKARLQGITAEVIQDAGRTQIEAGSFTVLGIGPAPKELVDQITGHLKLL